MSVVAKIKELAKSRGMSLQAVEAAVGLGTNTIYKWDKALPSADKLQKVADYFDVSVDYLLGREDSETDEVMELREQLRRQPGMRMLFDASKNATKEQLEAMAEMIRKWTE